MRLSFSEKAEKLHVLTQKIWENVPALLLVLGGGIGAIYGLATTAIGTGSIVGGFISAAPHVLGFWLAGGAMGVAAGMTAAGMILGAAKICDVVAGKYKLNEKLKRQVQKIQTKLPTFNVPILKAASVRVSKLHTLKVQDVFNTFKQPVVKEDLKAKQKTMPQSMSTALKSQ